MSDAHTVFFLGAGASKEFGYPLTAELLPEIRRAVEGKTKLFDEDEDAKVKSLWTCLHALVPGFRVSGELPSIVEVLSRLDHSTSSTVRRTGSAALGASMYT